MSTEGFVEVDGARLYYVEDGEGEPILFIHGNFLDGRMWQPQVAEFARDHRVIRMDVRGFGRSGYHPGPYSDHGDVLGLVRSMELDAVNVVGLSMGANIALEFALTHPDLTRSLVVVPGGLPGHDLAGCFDEGFEEFMSAAKRGERERAVDLIMRFAPMRPAGRIPSVRAALMTMLLEYSWENALDDYGDYRALKPAAYERLESVACPTLVITGELDIPEFREEAEMLGNRIPSAAVEMIRGAGHMVNMERPDAFDGVLRSFLAGSRDPTT